MWIAFALCSALGLGFYDIMKKLSVRANNVPVVLWFNTLFGTLLLAPVFIGLYRTGSWGLGDTATGHAMIFGKAVIVLASWILGYFAIKHLPLTIQGPINATRPVIVLVGALVVFGERLNALQWAGVITGFASLFMISRIGAKEGFAFKHSLWLWMCVGATMLGAVSALYDKFLMLRFKPLEVQAWYSFYQLLLMSAVVPILNRGAAGATPFRWRWAILGISLFLTGADLCYFYALSQPDSMIAIVSMIRRGSVLVSFFFGVLVLHEGNVRQKLLDLALLMVSLILLVAGA